MNELLKPIHEFLHCETPQAWIDTAIQDIPTLLIDHANCEKKAAGTAMSLIHKYLNHHDLLMKMARLIREELLHFEQVVKIMKRRGIAYENVSPSRYAARLVKQVRTYEPQALVDKLIIGAYIEARSCERFHALLPYVDEELSEFYASLLKSEARHFQDYLKLAARISPEPIEERIMKIGEEEAILIQTADSELRFHSGIPV